MTDANRCKSCGAERPANSPEGLCPRCLMQQALDTDPPLDGTGPGVELTVSLEPGSTSVLSRIAESIGGVPHVLLRDTDTAAGPDPATEPAAAGMPGPASRPEKYQLFGEIARGGMGAVLRGRDVDLGRELAVKVMLEAHKERPELVRRFVEEAQIGGQLQHPGVVPVYELGSFADHRPFFTMKLVRGRTMADLLKDRAEPGEDRPRFLSIFQAICQTMAYAHARGVIHRDLKPSNVMVGSFGEVQVMDWGLAKVLPRGDADRAEADPNPAQEAAVATARSGEGSDPSQAGSVMGTPAYMAPEQARGETDRVDERVDVFALGSILCEVLTGRPAFTGGGAVEILHRAARGDTAEAAARLDGCEAEPELIALARDCLAAEPGGRPGDAGAVAERVTAYLAGVQERLRAAELARVKADARAEEERKRRRLAMALAAAVVALMAIGGTGAAVYWQQRQAQAGRLELALGEAALLRAQAEADPEGDPAKWRLAVTAAARAGDLLGPLIGAAAQRKVRALRDEVAAGAEAARRDRDLTDKLVDIRSAKADDRDGSATDAAYLEAFRTWGIDPDRLDPAELATRVHSRPPAIAAAVAAALDDWAAGRRGRRKDRAGATRLTAAARAVDPDEWLNHLRDALEVADKPARRAGLLGLAGSLQERERPAVGFVLLGRALGGSDERERAEAVLRAGQRAHPRDVWLNYDLARTLEDLGRRGEALRFYAAARAIRPETAHAMAHALEASGEGEEAIAVFRDLERLRADDGRHLLCLSLSLLSRGRDAQARAVLGRAEVALRARIRLKPDLAEAHFNLSSVLLGQGKVDEAIAASRDAVRLQPDEPAAHGSLGVALLAGGKWDEAIAAFREVTRLNPDDAEGHNMLGNVLIEQGKRDEAIAAYRESIRLQPDNAAHHTNLGLALLGRGQRDEAVAEFRESIRLRPDLAEAHYSLGYALLGQGKVDEAIAADRAALRLKPNDAKIRNNLSWALAISPGRSPGDYDEAAALARRTVELNPTAGSCSSTLALAEYRRGRWGDSIAAAERSIALSKGVEPPSWFFLAMARARKGETAQAADWFDKAVAWTRKNAPKDRELLQFWAEAAVLLGRPGPVGPASPGAGTAPGTP